MEAVLSGFYTVWAMIAVGWVVGRTGVLDEQARYVLNRATFFICSPALVLTSLLGSELSRVIGPAFWVAGLATVITAAALFGVLTLATSRSSVDKLMAALCGSVVNGANMGFPIAAYVLGDISHALPVILMQQAIITPLYLFALSSLTQDASHAHRQSAVRALLRPIIENPTIIAAAIGVVIAVSPWRVPEVILEPIESLAQMAIPAMLLAFGISLIGARPLSAQHGNRALTIATSLTKLAVMPLIAAGLGLAFGLRGPALFAVVVMAALPTAQNVFVAADRFDAAPELTRDTVLVTSVCVVFSLLVISAVLG